MGAASAVPESGTNAGEGKKRTQRSERKGLLRTEKKMNLDASLRPAKSKEGTWETLHDFSMQNGSH